MAELISIVHPENERSRRVATKVGMTVERQVFNPVLDRDVDVWQMHAPPTGGAAFAGVRQKGGTR